MRAQIDTVFFEASGRSFESHAERAAFRERWLDRYLVGGSDTLLIAVCGERTVAGYLVGAIDDPAEQSRFSDISYFAAEFRELCRRFPAHLHINLAPSFRSLRLGTQLISAFCEYAEGMGAPGAHVVTGKEMRNVRFYERCGFLERGSTRWNGREIVFLGKDLKAQRS